MIQVNLGHAYSIFQERRHAIWYTPVKQQPLPILALKLELHLHKSEVSSASFHNKNAFVKTAHPY